MSNSKKDLADLELELQRLRALQEETTDAMAVLLLTDIVSEMEAEIKAEKTDDGKP
jgi:hypothetical protein